MRLIGLISIPIVARSYLARVVFAILAFSSIIVSAPSYSQAQVLSKPYVERTLANQYEKLAQTAVEYLANKQDFKIFVDVILDPSVDLAKEAVAMQEESLPGTIRSQPLDEDEFLGKLESLPHNRSVLLLLSPEVKEEQAALIKETLTGKLRLNLTGDIDKLTVKRGQIHEPKPESNRMPASIEENKKSSIDPMTLIGAGILLLALLGLAGFLLLKAKKTPAPPMPEPLTPPQPAPLPEKKNPFTPEPFKAEDSTLANEATAVSKNNKEETFDIMRYRAKNIDDVLENIRSIATQYPGLVSDAIQELSKDGGQLPRIAAMLELLGHSQALDLFRGVSQKTWASIGQYMSQYPISQENGVELEDMAILYRSMLAFVVEKKGNDPLSTGKSGLNEFSPLKIAEAVADDTIDDLITLLSGLPSALSNEVIVSMDKTLRAQIIGLLSKVTRIDGDKFKVLEERLIKKLRGGKSANFLNVDNEAKVYSALSQLSPFEEEALFHSLMLENREILKVARRHRLYPHHLRSLKTEILRDEISQKSGEEIARLLRGLDSTITSRVISVLSPKKQSQVQTVLSEISEGTMTREFSDARRAFLNEIYMKHIADNKELADELFDDYAGNQEAA